MNEQAKNRQSLRRKNLGGPDGAPLEDSIRIMRILNNDTIGNPAGKEFPSGRFRVGINQAPLYIRKL